MKVKSIVAFVVLSLGLATRSSTQIAENKGAEVTYFKSERVAEAFKKGEVLLNKENYMIHASHRDANGMAEIHTEDTDIIYVLEGAATFVTGGSVVDAKTTAAGEIRGASVRGGDTRTISTGDVIVVPNGVPNWFEKVSGPLNYYVVKVRRPQSDGRLQ